MSHSTLRQRLKLVPVVTVTLVGLFAQFQYPPNHDTSWLLEVSRKLAEGGTLYSADVVEINPPLIFQITSIAYAMARVLQVDALTVWRLLVFAQIALSLTLSRRWLTAILGAPGADLRYPLLALLALTLACLPGYDYGQREHFIVLWLTPYLVAAAGRCTGVEVSTGLRVATGLLPAAVLCLKPHYALSIVAVEATVAASRHSFRPLFDAGTITCVIATAVYGLTIPWLYPGYAGMAVSLGLRYYSSFGELAIQPVHVVYWVAGLLGLAVTREPRIAVVQARVFVAAAAGCFVAFIAQRKGWTYHFLPTRTFLLFAVSVGVASVARTALTRIFARYGGGHRVWFVMAGAVVLTLLSVVKTWSDVDRFSTSGTARDIRALSAYLTGVTKGRETSMAAFSYSLYPPFPVQELVRARWGSRFSCMWILPGILEEEAVGRPPGAFGRPYLIGAIHADFVRWHPEFVLVDERFSPSPLDELLKDEPFRALWTDYREIHHLRRFRVFQRIEAAADPRAE